LELVSVLIINYRTPELTLQCVNSLLKIETYSNFEILVLENGSKDESYEFLKKNLPKTVKLVLSEDNLGFAKGNNYLEKHAKGKYILFLNSDTYLTKSLLKELVSVLKENEKVAVVGPRILNPDNSIQPSVFRFPSIWESFCYCSFLAVILKPIVLFGGFDAFKYDKQRKVGFVSGACMLISRKDFDLIGKFDERFFMYAEETDLAYRLHLLGRFCLFSPTGDVVHLGGASSKEKITEMFVLNRKRYFLKHFGAFGSKFIILELMIGFLLRAIVFIFVNHRKAKEYFNKYIAYAHVL